MRVKIIVLSIILSLSSLIGLKIVGNTQEQDTLIRECNYYGLIEGFRQDNKKKGYVDILVPLSFICPMEAKLKIQGIFNSYIKLLTDGNKIWASIEGKDIPVDIVKEELKNLDVIVIDNSTFERRKEEVLKEVLKTRYIRRR
jgi:hypothetical protein